MKFDYNVKVITNDSNYKRVSKVISKLPKYPPITLIITNEVSEMEIHINLYKRLSYKNLSKLISSYSKVYNKVITNFIFNQ